MTRRDTRETGPSGRRFGATELPPEMERVVQQAKRLEWATLGVIVVTIVLVAIVMGSSQAMRAAWIEDLLSLIPPIAFLVALRVARMAPTRARPYGSHRSVGVGHLVAAVALSVMGVVLVGDSLLGLVTAEHPPIGTFDLFGHTVWQGWFMMAVMALSVPGPMILGHKKLTLAEQLHDRVLYADADMNKADWQTGVATIVGVAGIGLGWWWADSAAAIFVGVSIVLDGWKNLKEAVTNLADRRAATIDGARPHPLIDRVERVAWAEPWVRHAGARVRDEGHVFHVEMFVVPHEGADVTVGRCCALRDAIAALDWKLQDVVVAPVDELPAEVHGGRSGEHQTGEE
ncbi:MULTISPECIES: cation diffusion facilitator family transporter [Micrococcus]|uniref:Cation transporter n=2 Tax=Micrococcus TaxID=1269 RepID=A0AAP5TAQ9_9MICC|nr:MULTISPECIES: cation transporter [Micrococcus]MBA9080207.1 divalent metal cation (Fe/Co/Zn/Cd) transporter [Micrococcus aloeverae]MDV7177557.1 cation transporter [Micrococcus yunnanensis]